MMLNDLTALVIFTAGIVVGILATAMAWVLS